MKESATKLLKKFVIATLIPNPQSLADSLGRTSDALARFRMFVLLIEHQGTSFEALHS